MGASFIVYRRFPPAVILARRRLVGELVVFSHQLVGSVVLVCGRDAPPGDRGYVPVVVVGVFADRVAAVLVCDQQGYLWDGQYVINNILFAFSRFV